MGAGRYEKYESIVSFKYPSLEEENTFEKLGLGQQPKSENSSNEIEKDEEKSRKNT